MAEKKCTIYDMQEFYKENLEGKVNEIKKICRLNKIPVIFTFAVANDEKDTIYKTDGVSTGSMEIYLTEDYFENYLIALQKGTKLVLKDAKTLTAEQEAYMMENIEDEMQQNRDEMESSSEELKNLEGAISFVGDL